MHSIETIIQAINNYQFSVIRYLYESGVTSLLILLANIAAIVVMIRKGRRK